MADIANSFTATGVGPQIGVRDGEQYTYLVTGTWVGTIQVEKSTNAGASWEVIESSTANISSTTVQHNDRSGATGVVRFNCTAFTSGTIVTTVSDVTTEITHEFKDASGSTILALTEGGANLTGNWTVSGTSVVTGASTLTGAQTFTGAAAFAGALTVDDDNLSIRDNADQTKILQFQASGITTATTRTITVPDANDTMAVLGTAQTFSAAQTYTSNVIRTSQTRIINGIGKVGSAAGWAVGAAANTDYLGTVAASQTAGTFVVSLPGFKVGDTITGVYPIGQIESAGGAVTLDFDLRAHTNAAADPTDASVLSGTQISVTADTAVGIAHVKTGSHVVLATNSYYCLLTATTAGSTDIILLAIAVVVTES